eukprot:NODE_64_length_26047_cov_1.706837.p10 type:complete len:272 gc:universal NODE_64_length_26047_cov_1.706837:18246-17431(-)
MLIEEDIGPLPTQELHIFAEHFDRNSCLTRNFVLTLYIDRNNSQYFAQGVRIFDQSRNKLFLKKSRIAPLSITKFKKFECIELFSRTYKITGFGNEFTEEVIYGISKIAFVLQSLDEVDQIGHFESFAKVHILKMGYWPNKDCNISGLDGDKIFIIAIGSTEKPMKTISSNFIGDNNIIEKLESVKLEFLFQNENSAVVILTDYIINNRKISFALENLRKSFRLTCITTLSLSREEASNYLEIYAGVLPNISHLCNTLCKGNCVIMYFILI